MISKLSISDLDCIFKIVNIASIAYKGVIPTDRYKQPYMSKLELEQEIEDGVVFYGFFKETKIIGVMGIQQVNKVTLIRHAYVIPEYQKIGVGRSLLKHLMELSRTKKVYVGTWQVASWAIRFYEKNGFVLVSTEEKNDLLSRYWKIPKRQIETSVVLKYKNR